MDRKVFFDKVRASPFSSLSFEQVDGVSAILDAWEKCGYGDDRWLAYCLGTAFWETGRAMQPVKEIGKGRGHGYGNPAGPWHQAYYGRGDVQLTWETNYKHATDRLHALGLLRPEIDLEKDADAALMPDISAMVLIIGCCEGWFTGRKLGAYFGHGWADWLHARQVVNGMDRAALIAGYAEEFYAAIEAAS